MSVEGEAVLWKPKVPRTPASYVSADRSDGGEDSLLDLANPGDALTLCTSVAGTAPVHENSMAACDVDLADVEF